MKRLITLRSLVVITCLLLGLSLHAEALTIHVETPGTLSVLSRKQRKQIKASVSGTSNLKKGKPPSRLSSGIPEFILR